LPEYPIYELTVGELPAGFYAPRMAQVMARVPESHIALPAGVKQLVWFVDHWSPLTERPLGLTEIELPHGRYLYLLSIGRKPVDDAARRRICALRSLDRDREGDWCCSDPRRGSGHPSSGPGLGRVGLRCACGGLRCAVDGAARMGLALGDGGAAGRHTGRRDAL